MSISGFHPLGVRAGRAAIEPLTAQAVGGVAFVLAAIITVSQVGWFVITIRMTAHFLTHDPR